MHSCIHLTLVSYDHKSFKRLDLVSIWSFDEFSSLCLRFLTIKPISHLTMVCYHQNPIRKTLGLTNLNSNKEIIESFGPKQFGVVWVERDKAHSSVEDWHRASNAMQERRAHSPKKSKPLVKANLGGKRGVNLNGPMTTLGQELGVKQLNSEKGSLRRENSSAMGNGKSVSKVSSSQLRGSTTNFGSKKLWTSLFPPISGCRQWVRI